PDPASSPQPTNQGAEKRSKCEGVEGATTAGGATAAAATAGAPPVDTTRSTAEPLADWAPAAGFWPITLPEGTVVLDCIVTVPTVRPAPVMALVAAACVWPTTFGTGTGAGGGAPLETTRLTATPLATLVPAAGLWLITLPGATVVLDCIVTAPTVRPALVMALVAAACIWPTTFGTSTVGGGGDPICTSACVWPSTTREWMTLTGTPRGLW